MRFEGVIGDRLAANLEQWLLPAPYANPGMLYMMRVKEQKPRPELVPWYGEFPGKYLTAAVPAWRISRDERLRKTIQYVVDQLAAGQQPSGYLGPFPREHELTGYVQDGMLYAREGENLWDVWGHYHCLMGLMQWHDATGDETAWRVLTKAADHLCEVFLSGKGDLARMNMQEMNMAVIHAFGQLYRQTKKPDYLDMVRYVERCWQAEGAGDYVRTALAGQEFYQTPKPRWESLHDILGIAELYYISRSAEYRRAFEHIWWSIVKTDRHNTGGFTSGEQAQGNPYDPRAIETCCTISWMLLCYEMYRLTGESYPLDELELATFNGMLGAQHPSGRWWTYNTPMDGVRRASAHDIVFQAFPGSPELNCCSVNGPRGLAMLADWAADCFGGDVHLNYYGPCQLETLTPAGQPLSLSQHTAYPVEGAVRIGLALPAPEAFPLLLRIPVWSRNTACSVNGEPVREEIRPGQFLRLERTWHSGDVVELQLDLAPHLWPGDREAAGKASLYHGPILLAYDRRFNERDVGEMPALPATGLCFAARSCDSWPQPILCYAVTAEDGSEVVLCDYATAGAWGTPYATWLPMEHVTVPYVAGQPEWVTPLNP